MYSVHGVNVVHTSDRDLLLGFCFLSVPASSEEPAKEASDCPGRLDPSHRKGFVVAPPCHAPVLESRCFSRSSPVHGTEAHAADDVGFGLGALGDGGNAESVFLVEVDDERGEVFVAAFSQCAGEPLGC